MIVIRTLTVTDDAPFTIYGYDAVGNLTSVTNALGHTTTYEYDALSRRVKEILPDPDDNPLTDNTPVAEFIYDAAGNLLQLKDPLGNTTTWSYDALNRVTSDVNELGKARTYEYDAVGNRIRATNRNGLSAQFTYDGRNRVIAEEWIDGGLIVHTINFEYLADGALQWASDSAGTFTFDYDGRGNVTSATQQIAGLGVAVVLGQDFDPAGNRTGLSVLLGGTADFTNTYFYDNLSRLTSVTQQGTAGGNAVAQKRADFKYDVSA